MATIRRYAAVILAAGVLAGCAASPTPQESATGYAQVYILRPPFNEKVSRKDSPTLYIGGREAARLQFERYSSFTLAPGTYQLELKPSRSDATLWTGAWQLQVRSGEVYHVAIWNDVESVEKLKAWYVGLPMPYLVTQEHNKALRYEVLSKEDAALIMPMVKPVKALGKTFTPMP
ncbi:MAG TPA: hypothetical protein VGQ22_18925 [Steroidobacteraceae bacterium]|jgi:hypothetical protein|nr:hypothetical protein [Steroidobacteraceae bacterium]